MKLISLNTWGCRITEPVFGYIDKNTSSTDIFCFQEISRGGEGKTDKDEIKNAYEQISKLLPGYTGYFWGYGEEGHYYDKRKDEIDFEFGVTCFVRKELSQESKGGIHLHNPNTTWSDYSGRFAAGIVLAVQVDGYLIFNVHGLWQGSIKEDTEAKIEQTKQIINFANIAEGKKVICGDFNLLPHTKSIKLIADKYTDLVEKFGIESTRSSLYTKPLRYSDYVFTDKDINVSDFSVPNIDISDHLPLVLEFN